MPCAAAASPICSARQPRHLEHAGGERVDDLDVGAGEQLPERVGLRRADANDVLEARRTKSSTLMSAISSAAADHDQVSAVSAISLIRCEETNTVRPSAASP